LYDSPNSCARNAVQKNTTPKRGNVMTGSISPLPQPFSPEPMPKGVPNVHLLANQMQDGVLTLADQLQKILEDPTLAAQKTFLDEFAHNSTALSQTVDQAILLR
jgi:hypothetical protein